MYCIYMISNTVNDKVYIGSTKHYKRRKKEHLFALEQGNHHSNHLQNAVNKYGIDKFHFSILETEIDDYNRIEEEQKWIKLKNSSHPDFGYNLSIPNENNSPTFTRKETIEKLRRIATEQMLGRKLTDIEYKRHLKKRQNEKDFAKMKAYWYHNNPFDTFSDDSIPLYVICNDTNEILHSFISIGECCRELNITDNAVRSRLNRKRKIPLHKKYQFVKWEDYDKNKDYRYKYPVRVPKEKKEKRIFRGHPVLVIKLDTCEIVQRYSNMYELAEKENVSRKQAMKILQNELTKSGLNSYILSRFKSDYDIVYESDYPIIKKMFDTGEFIF